MLDAAAAEFVAHGYEKTVVSDIARRAGVTVGAIYARWPGKSEVMVAALDHFFERLLPERRMEQMGLTAMSTPDLLEEWGVRLLDSHEVQDVLIQAFGSARNNPAIQARVQQFLDDHVDQMRCLVESGRSQGHYDPGFSTGSVTLLCEAIGIGAHVLISTGLDDRHIPSEEEWRELLAAVIHLIYPKTGSTESSA